MVLRSDGLFLPVTIYSLVEYRQVSAVRSARLSRLRVVEVVPRGQDWIHIKLCIDDLPQEALWPTEMRLLLQTLWCGRRAIVWKMVVRPYTTPFDQNLQSLWQIKRRLWVIREQPMEQKWRALAKSWERNLFLKQTLFRLGNPQSQRQGKSAVLDQRARVKEALSSRMAHQDNSYSSDQMRTWILLSTMTADPACHSLNSTIKCIRISSTATTWCNNLTSNRPVIWVRTGSCLTDSAALRTTASIMSRAFAQRQWLPKSQTFCRTDWWNNTLKLDWKIKVDLFQSKT